MRCLRSLAALGVAIAASSAFAQYEVKEWANFEDGKMPAKVISIGGGSDKRVQVVAVDSITTQPAEFKNPEVGKYVLRLEAAPDGTDAKSWQAGMAVGDVIDRSQIGPNGRAMFQADFYVEGSGSLIPSLAVLAMEPPAGGVSHIDSVSGSFYRFGITLNDRLYYSQIVPGGGKAKVFEQDKDLLGKMPRPGWHRFQIVCEGPEVIRCYVDGRETGFSPLRDSSMQKIMVGMLLAENKDAYVAYADNISIQMSNDAPALPASPFDQGWNVAAGASKKAKSAGVSSALPTASLSTELAKEWLPPLKAWEEAKNTKQGLLLYFYAPGVDRVEKVNGLLQSDAAAKAYIQKHSCARIDVNQLEGGSIAKKYSIFKVPTFLVISPDAKSYKKYSPGPNETWPQIEQQLAPL